MKVHRKREQKKKKNSKNKMVIDMTEVMLNSANKMGRHLDAVKSGTGIHKSKKDYSRKRKHKGKELSQDD